MDDISKRDGLNIEILRMLFMVIQKVMAQYATPEEEERFDEGLAAIVKVIRARSRNN